jgi:RimJ/RimL family protein N-acetyltransferase
MIEYRDATLDDLPAVGHVFSATLLDLQQFGGIWPTAQNLQKFSVLFKQALESGQHGIALAFDAGKCIGGVISISERVPLDGPENRAVCWGAWLDPDFRRKGIAAHLLEMSFARLKALGFSEVISDVSVNNLASLALCRKRRAQITHLKITFPL